MPRGGPGIPRRKASAESRLWSHVEKGEPSACWPWTGAVNQRGHGYLLGAHGRQVLAHRLAWELANGPADPQASIIKSCDEPACINVAHMRVGSALECRREMKRHGRNLGKKARPAEVRFWARVQKGPECWTWTGALDKDGYGHLDLGARSERAHRYSWELANGQKIPEGLGIRHDCDNARCVRPDHLRTGTQAENIADREARGRHPHPKGEQSSRAKLTEHDVIDIRSLHTFGARQKDLAEAFDVSPGAILSILHRKTWKHIP